MPCILPTCTDNIEEQQQCIYEKQVCFSVMEKI